MDVFIVRKLVVPGEEELAMGAIALGGMRVLSRELGVEHHVGITASVDTFYEGQERTGSANPNLLRALRGITEEYRRLNVLNYETESGTLFKMGGVYSFAAGCMCGVIAQRTEAERVVLEAKAIAVENAIRVAVEAAMRLA